MCLVHAFGLTLAVSADTMLGAGGSQKDDFTFWRTWNASTMCLVHAFGLTLALSADAMLVAGGS